MKNENLNAGRSIKPWVFETQSPISLEEAQEIGLLGTDGDEEAQEKEAAAQEEKRGGARDEETNSKGG